MNPRSVDDQITISTSPEKVDINLVYNFLTHSYWAEGRTKQAVETSIKNSLCFGIYIDKKQIGFARVLSDYVTLAYLLDVFIIEEYRGKGFGIKLINEITNYPELQNVKKWMLVTADAHKLYEKFGFTMLKNPEMSMEMFPGKISDL